MNRKLFACFALIFILAVGAGCSPPATQTAIETPTKVAATLSPSKHSTARVTTGAIMPPTSTLPASTAVAQPPTSTEVAATPTATPRPKAPTATPNPDWSEYRNDLFGYRLRLPLQATVEALAPEYFPPDELPSGATYETYLEQLRQRYPGICVRVRFGLGYVYVSAPLNAGARYSPCGRTGVGANTTITQTLALPIDGALYETTEREYVSPPGARLVDHSNHIVVWLDDGSRIEIGSVPVEARWEDYLDSTRDILLQIVSSYQSLGSAAPEPTPENPP